jgi:hypothetical protein
LTKNDRAVVFAYFHRYDTFILLLSRECRQGVISCGLLGVEGRLFNDALSPVPNHTVGQLLRRSSKGGTLRPLYEHAQALLAQRSLDDNSGRKIAGVARWRLPERRRPSRKGKGQAMTDKPGMTYIVSVFEKPNWRTVITTKDKAEAEALHLRPDLLDPDLFADRFRHR